MPVNAATSLLIALCGAAACHAAAGEICTPTSPATEAPARSSFTKERAVVEDVLASVQDGYRSRAYIVTWHGSRVLVSDPLAQSSQSSGDSIDFIASRNEVTGKRLLTFISTEPEPHRTAGVPGASSLEDSAATETGVVEEVLSSQDNGFQFTGYVVRAHDQQIAVSDPLALSHHAVGEQIDYLTLRMASTAGLLLAFQVQLSAAERGSNSKSLCGSQSSLETGVVDQVLYTNASGYEYRAYVIEWRDSHVVIDDPAAATNYQPGDSVSFWASRLALPSPDNHKDLQFTFDRPAQTTAVSQRSDFKASIARESAPVQAVLATELDGYRAVAYLVNWHNTPVAVIDAFATTHFAAGDRITFSVARSTDSSRKELNFMLFEFPNNRCAKTQPANDSSPLMATPTPTAPTSDCHS
jgi:hypothetical protein